MAIISCSKKLTIHIVKGELNFDKALEAIKEFYDEKPTKDVLWDLREGTWKNLSANLVHIIVDFVSKYAETRAGGRSAMVVPADIDYGIARIFQSYSENLPYETRVFRTMDEAIRWLTAE